MRRGAATGRRILVVAEAVPPSLDQGAAIRNRHLVAGLARGNHVTLVGYDAPGADTDALENVEIKTAPPPRQPTLLSRAGSLVSRDSFQATVGVNRELRSLVRRTLAEREFDIIQIERIQLLGALGRTRAAVILDEHNIEYLLRLQLIARQPAIKRLLNQFDAAKFRRFEQSAWREVEGCTSTSSEDSATITRFAPKTPVAVVPNGVDLDYFVPGGQSTSDQLVFTGLMDYGPNVDAVRVFAREVLPLVRQGRPNARFTVVGKNPPPELVRELGAGVEFTGAVPDVRPWLARAAVVVVPLRAGSGTRIKILEALAAGRAVVSTPIGCEGIEAVSGEHLQVAEVPADFAHEVSRLLADPPAAARLGANGRILVEQRYGWQQAVARLEDFYGVVEQERERRLAEQV